jgi:flagellar biosynthesis/type III secretory pathway M-ring protein FliF/YscJ
MWRSNMKYKQASTQFEQQQRLRREQLMQLQAWVKQHPKPTAALIQQWLKLERRR